MKKLLSVIVLGCLVLGPAANCACASEIDILVRKLVEKKVLTAGEAQQILTETKEEVRKELAKGESYSVPKWTQNIKVKGDIRTRYQYQKRKGDATSVTADQTRGRIRLRAGAEPKVNEKVTAAFGLASGNDGESRSTNQTFTDNFAKKPIWIDYAYATYTPYDWVSLTGGRMINPIWQTGDMLWDTDINPEGLACVLKYEAAPSLQLFANNAFFVLDEASGDKSDPFMIAAQPGFKWDVIKDKMFLKGAFTYYVTGSVKSDSVLDQRSSRVGNTTIGAGAATRYMYDYDSLAASLQLGFKEPLGPSFAFIPYADIFGDYIYNPDPSDDNIGWLIGGTIGSQKIKKWGDWQAKYMYRNLERDCWLDTYPDSDFYAGATNVKGHEAAITIGLMENMTFGFDYYYAKYITGAFKRPESLYQCDLVLKF